MFRNHARKVVLALSLIAAAGSLIPAAQLASAAPVSGDTAATAVRLEVGTLKDVKVTMFSGLRGLGTNEWQGASAAQEAPLGTFSAPDYRLVGYTCVPKPYQYCDFGEVRLTTSNGGTARYVNDTDGFKAWP